MCDTNGITFNSSQEIIVFSSQTPLESLADDYQPSTQEIITAHTQEASNASDFFDNLRESQITGSDSSISHSNENKIRTNELTDVSIDSFNGFETNTGKKKRGRKRKIRTPEEMVIHLKEKKEKNRLAAQRLRQKKGTEIAKYDQEVVQLEANVRAKRQFAELIESNVNQLRNKIKIMFGPKIKVNHNSPHNTKQESIKNSSTNNNSLNDNVIQQNSGQNRNKKQLTKPMDASNHLCISR